MEATPRPWAFDAKTEEIWSPGKGLVATVKQRGPLVKVASDYRLLETEANGELIVRAVNSHSRLIEALELAVRYANEDIRPDASTIDGWDAALAAARGEGE